MNNFASAIMGLIFLVWYLAGLVLAHGVWSTAFALVTPWGMYLVVEKVLQLVGWLS